MKINLEYLLGAVNNCMDDFQNYRSNLNNKKSLSREDLHDYYKNDYASSNQLYNLAKILGITQDKLIKITRLVNRWEAKNGYQKCFPIYKHETQLTKFLFEK